MTGNYSDAFRLLANADNILLLTHRLPDGDAVGSIFALYLALKKMGKNVRCEIDTIPKSLKIAAVENYGGDFEEQFIAAVDVGDKKLLSQEQLTRYGDRIDLCIDHHGTNSAFAKYTLLDSGACAACQVLYDMFNAVGFELTPDIAKSLYVGISTDTGCFRYGNTTAKTLRTVASLMEIGVDTAYINTEIFETKTKEYASFEALALNNLKTYLEGKCAVMVITKEMYDISGLSEVDDKAVNALPRQIEGVLAGITVKEKKDGTGWRVSVRSREPVSAADICVQLNGGGHRLAAGCELTGNVEQVRDTLINATKNVLDRL